MVVFGQKLLYSGKSGGFRSHVVIFEQSGHVLEKVVVIGKGGCMRASFLLSRKVVVFGQSDCIGVKVVVFRQRWLHSGKVVVFGQNVVFVQSGCFWEK